jgi:UDPglucose--hexose-1-phosphate uridylyltransferase
MAKSVNEVRKDMIGRKVVITAVRGARPHDNLPSERPVKTVLPEKCFFCPGNEHLTPPEIDRIERDGKWEIRCFPNKFPAFSSESKKAYGRHEVIVETPEHQKTLSELSEENLLNYLSMVKRRMESAAADPKLTYTIVFKNEGKAGGASLEHSHTQLVGMPFVPDYVKKLAKKSGKIAKMKQKHLKNVFAKNGYFIALCPKAPRFHLETWIVPAADANSLVALSDEKLRALASILKSVLAAFDAATGFGPYNIIFHSAPHSGGEFPFHLEVLSRLSIWAGFELGTEVVMVSELPEMSAKVLGAKLVEIKDKNAI